MAKPLLSVILILYHFFSFMGATPTFSYFLLQVHSLLETFLSLQHFAYEGLKVAV